MGIDSLLLDLLGFAATAFSVCMWIPQARTTWLNRNDPIRLAGVSETTQWLMMIGYLLWGLFGVLSESLWVAAPSMVSIPLALATILVVRRGRRLPQTRSVSIMSTSEPMSVAVTTGSIPIVSTDAALAVGEAALMAPIGTVQIMSTENAISVDGSGASQEFTTTGPVPILA
jgi:uncharacterized protein with PQ loop repeat